MSSIWIVYNAPSGNKEEGIDWISESAVEDEVNPVCEALESLGHAVTVYSLSSIPDICFHLSGPECPDLIFNLAEGFRGKASLEMNVASLYELLGIPYTGNSARTLGFAQDKVLTKRLLSTANIETPAWAVYNGGSLPELSSLRFPLIAKPSREDASLGIGANGVFKDQTSLETGIRKLYTSYRQPILIEEFIDGREFNLSILQDRGRIEILPVSEIRFDTLSPNAPKITSYDAKWLTESDSYHNTPSVCPAQIGENLAEKLIDIAQRVFLLLEGKDYGRVDFRMNAENTPYVLEYNPNPDISIDSGFLKSLKASGRSYEDFVKILLQNNPSENEKA